MKYALIDKDNICVGITWLATEEDIPANLKGIKLEPEDNKDYIGMKWNGKEFI